jgi:hypothetical protein
MSVIINRSAAIPVGVAARVQKIALVKQSYAGCSFCPSCSITKDKDRGS